MNRAAVTHLKHQELQIDEAATLRPLQRPWPMRRRPVEHNPRLSSTTTVPTGLYRALLLPSSAVHRSPHCQAEQRARHSTLGIANRELPWLKLANTDTNKHNLAPRESKSPGSWAELTNSKGWEEDKPPLKNSYSAASRKQTQKFLSNKTNQTAGRNVGAKSDKMLQTSS